jgi:hypothetical protein
MQGTRRDQLVSWTLGAIAGISIGVSIIDMIGITPGWAARLTPFFVGVLLLYVVLERERVDSVKYIVRRLDKGIEKLRDDLRTDETWRTIRRPNGHETSDQYRSIPWKGMIFRSQSELRIAKALDHAGVLFFPPAKARLTIGKTRQSREIDFLIFSQGQWALLEVDGPWHTAANDEARDRVLHNHGIRTIYRYDAQRCYDSPAEVVSEFLAKLPTAGRLDEPSAGSLSTN